MRGDESDPHLQCFLNDRFRSLLLFKLLIIERIDENIGIDEGCTVHSFLLG